MEKSRFKRILVVYMAVMVPLLAVLLVPLLYDIAYRYIPKAVAVFEHLTNFPPGRCRILNVKALQGRGEVQWIVVKNRRTNLVPEHVRGYKDGKAVDLTCQAEVCEEIGFCGSFVVDDYRLVNIVPDRARCPVDRYDLRQAVFEEYLRMALLVDKFQDGH